MSKRLDTHIEKSEEEAILSSRQRILRFSDEITMGILHSKEAFVDILGEIDKYEGYCMEHPHFPNNRCVLACANIKDIYKERLDKNDFLNIREK